MAGPWEKYNKALKPWEKHVAPPSAEPDEPAYSGAILPASRDDQGNVYFDPNAGLVGAVKRAITLPREVMRGEVDPTSDEGIARATEMGMIVSPVNPAVRSGERAIPGVARARQYPQKPTVPTAEELTAAGGASLKRLRSLGVDYTPKSVSDMAGAVRTNLEGDGILAELAPKSFAILKKLETPPKGSVAAPLSGVVAARKALRNAAKDFANPTEQLAASRIIQGLDDFIKEADPRSIMAGPASSASKILREGNANYAAGKRSQVLSGLEDAAELRAAAANSGKNIGNTIRQRVASILIDPKKRAGFSEDEIAALEQVARGTATQNVLRWVGNVLGGGGGLGTMLTTGAGGVGGAAVGGPVGAGIGAIVLPATGAAAKAASNRSTVKALGNADKTVRMRSPLFEQRVRNPPMAPLSADSRALLERALGIGLINRKPATTEEYRQFILDGGA